MWKISTLAAVALFMSCGLTAGDHQAKPNESGMQMNCPMQKCCCKSGKDKKCCHNKAKCQHCGKVVKITPVARTADDENPGIIAVIEEYTFSEDVPENASAAGQNQGAKPAK